MPLLLTDRKPAMLLSYCRRISISIAVMASMHSRADEKGLPWQPSPSIAPGRDESSDERRLIQAMIGLLTRTKPTSDAEALKYLRRDFPESSLATRIAAFVARFKRGPGSSPYMPR